MSNDERLRVVLYILRNWDRLATTNDSALMLSLCIDELEQVREEINEE